MFICMYIYIYMGVSILFCVSKQSPFPTNVKSLLRKFYAHINTRSEPKIMATKQQCPYTMNTKEMARHNIRVATSTTNST